MSPRILISSLLVGSFLILSIACGGGGNSNASIGAQTAEVTGLLDFSDTSLSKPRFSASTSGNVTLMNLTTGENTIVSFTGNTYTATVTPGNFEVQALRNDGKQLKALIADVVAGSGNPSLDVDIDSTVVAQYVDLFQLEYTALSNVRSILTSSTNLLTSSSNSHSDEDRQTALIALALKKKLQSDIQNNVNILTSTYSPDETVIKTFSTNVLVDIVNLEKRRT